jgi:hypothetical protein
MASFWKRFWAKVEMQPDDGCWTWTGALNTYGYGQFWLNGKQPLAHRLLYEVVVGPIPAEMTLDHACHNESACAAGNACPHRRCIRPTHLRLTTIGENVRNGRGPAWQLAKTSCPHGHPYDEANTYVSPQGHRKCKACRRLGMRAGGIHEAAL